jgi:hypothetical protein
VTIINDINSDGIVELMASVPLRNTLFLLFRHTDGTVREDVKIGFDGKGTIDHAMIVLLPGVPKAVLFG